jgi:hypothetical protein
MAASDALGLGLALALSLALEVALALSLTLAVALGLDVALGLGLALGDALGVAASGFTRITSPFVPPLVTTPKQVEWPSVTRNTRSGGPSVTMAPPRVTHVEVAL